MGSRTLSSFLRRREAAWRRFLDEQEPGAEVIAVGRSDGDRRVLKVADEAVKVVRHPAAAPGSTRPLTPEHGILRLLAREGLVAPPRYARHLEEATGDIWELLRTPWLPGERAADAGRRVPPAELVRAVAHLNRRGVAHGDLNIGNVLVGEDGSIRLVDYERAWFGHPLRVAIGDLTGRWLPPGQPPRPLLRTLGELLADRHAPSRRRRPAREAGRSPVERKATWRPVSGDREVAAAWLQATAVNGGPLHYGFELSGSKYRGAWSWSTVWESIRHCGLPLAGLPLAEVSSGPPLASVWCLLEGAVPAGAVVPAEGLALASRRLLAAFSLPLVEVDLLHGAPPLGAELVVLSDPSAARLVLEAPSRLLGPGVRHVIAATSAAGRGGVLTRLRGLGFAEVSTVGLGTSPVPIVCARRAGD